jgi:glutathione S-transferase
MRFMMIVKASKDSEAGVLPPREMFEEMGRFNEEMVKAGVMLAGEGLQASSQGARVFISDAGREVRKGPFPLTDDLIAGFWIIQVGSLDEAIEWARRCPAPHGEGVETHLELRRIFEAEDFGEALTPELREAEERLRSETGKRN